MINIFSQSKAQKEITKIKRDFMRNMSGILPKVAPSGQRLDWCVQVEYIPDNNGFSTDTMFKLKESLSKSQCDCNAHCLELSNRKDCYTDTIYKMCYCCGKEWFVNIPYEIPKDIVVVGNRKYKISVKQCFLHSRMIDHTVYSFDTLTKKLTAIEGIMWSIGG